MSKFLQLKTAPRPVRNDGLAGGGAVQLSDLNALSQSQEQYRKPLPNYSGHIAKRADSVGVSVHGMAAAKRRGLVFNEPEADKNPFVELKRAAIPDVVLKPKTEMKAEKSKIYVNRKQGKQWGSHASFMSDNELKAVANHFQSAPRRPWTAYENIVGYSGFVPKSVHDFD
eukprot:NODE_1164_length_1068_cov_286.404318_g889_i0.p1 GENE.NODE_1164_length_1068_cov_286.404318_g889_i0~~NODE_1164_length_1068_cov_286.404318_g889_i0.p1  ORF type:complete len:170 (+),score=34.16 NODE_1164_length_1068_cov_286.404318_g889_i0:90-599(+)